MSDRKENRPRLVTESGGEAESAGGDFTHHVIPIAPARQHLNALAEHDLPDRARQQGRGREGDSVRGHSRIEAGVDSAFLVKREDGADEITVKCTKARRKPIDTFGALWTYELADDGETLHKARFCRADPHDLTAESGAERQARILAVLTVGPKNQTGLAEAVGGIV